MHRLAESDSHSSQANSSEAVARFVAFIPEASAQSEFLKTIHHELAEEHTARERRVAGLVSSLSKKTIDRHGTALDYFVTGSTGTPVIFITALGQGFKYWHRLAEQLISSHRIIMWEPRGLFGYTAPFRLQDHVEDLDAILRHEQIGACHLIGWCTGPKVSIEYYLLRPESILSMVFLNSTFKCDEQPDAHDTAYEHNLESLCRMVNSRPSLSGSVMKTLQSAGNSEPAVPLEEMEGNALAEHVLSLMSTHLKSHVIAPFQSEESTLNYVRQLLDFWSHDLTPLLPSVKAPVLLISAEYDQIASPSGSSEAAGRFPNARHIQLAGGTHYCLYDRPEWMANLMKAFFRESEESFPVARTARG